MRIPFKIHPRALGALGADLVTNDVVAIIELVKNAYDAFATRVDVRFAGENSSPLIEIEDNGTGMDKETIKSAWCTVATPYRREHPYTLRQGHKRRRASGEKGLGRLSAARLGDELEMLTQSEDSPCWRVDVDWREVASAKTIEECGAVLKQVDSPFTKSGTILRIRKLRTQWDEAKLADLRDNLARLVPPFSINDEFAIHLSTPRNSDPACSEAVLVETPEFLNHPKYVIHGSVDDSGDIKYKYKYRQISGQGQRAKAGAVTWSQIREQTEDTSLKAKPKPGCGPFSFEVRAWDIAPQDTQEIAEEFELKKSSVRRDIRAFKGLSVYRDGVLVLPKSETARDWLGLDLRRVGRVGPRLSTPQVVGHVAISADANPRIEDTSDRERLAANPEVTAFEEILRAVVSTLENEREKDRKNTTKEKRVVELFQQLSARDLIESVDQVAKEGGTVEEALPLIRAFGNQLEKAREEIEERFVYYSRLATVGTIAQMLVHEVRNRTTVISNALEAITTVLRDSQSSEAALGRIATAGSALRALDQLAETFAPLATRSFKRRLRNCVVEDSIRRSIAMMAGEIKARKIQVRVPSGGQTAAAVDPGELDTVLLNLLSNAAYWVGRVDEGERSIDIKTSALEGGKRIRVLVHDSGPGVPDEDVEKIFLPGVTNKPGGIGMGLTVAAEIVSEYGGRLALVKPGRLGGATFAFDIPSRIGNN